MHVFHSRIAAKHASRLGAASECSSPSSGSTFQDRARFLLLSGDRGSTTARSAEDDVRRRRRRLNKDRQSSACSLTLAYSLNAASHPLSSSVEPTHRVSSWICLQLAFNSATVIPESEVA
ncbi:hypothetical protein CFRS1_v002555 [Colletotrichum fructicola]|nr:hypothetical protein CFRS1_v002555 [Colletotrichum fructicola]